MKFGKTEKFRKKVVDRANSYVNAHDSFASAVAGMYKTGRNKADAAAMTAESILLRDRNRRIAKKAETASRKKVKSILKLHKSLNRR